MILTVAFVALLLCAQAQAGGTITKPECADWACFAPKSCTGKTGLVVVTVDFDTDLNGDCAEFLMIRPYTAKRWLVVLESWKSGTTELKVLQGSTELFACTKSGSESVASSNLPKFEKQPKDSTRPLSCKFLVGDGTTDVIQVTAGVGIILNPGASTIDSPMFHVAVTGKIMCDPSNVKFADSLEPYEVAIKADVQPKSVSCSDPYKLECKLNDKYVDVDGAMECKGTVDNYKYAFKTVDRIEKEEKGQFEARCHAKVCAFCTALTPPATGKPKFDDVGGCKTLTCAKFFKIGSKITDDKATCTKSGEDYVWMVGTTKLDASTECADAKQCKAITTCKEPDCMLISGLPKCADDKKVIAAKINGRDVTNVTVACDGNRGKLTYAENGKAIGDLPEDLPTFTCADAPETNENIATGSSDSLATELKWFIVGVVLILLLLLAGGIGGFIGYKRMTAKDNAAMSKRKRMKKRRPRKSKARSKAGSTTGSKSTISH